MSTGLAERSYTEAEIKAMDTPDLLSLYKRTGDETLKWPLVLRYEGLIKSAALQIRGVYSSFAQVDDIVSEGILTLLSSIDKFDLDKGIKFETYVAKRIRGMVIDLARKQDWLPRNIRQRAKEIDTAVSHLANELGRFPTDQEVAGHLGIPTDKYQKEAARVALSNTLSLDALMDARDLEGYRFEVSTEDPAVQPEAVLEDQELQETLAQGIDTENPYLTTFLKHRNIEKLSRGLLVELVNAIYVHEDKSIEIEFNFADQYRRIAEYIENNKVGLCENGGKAG